MEAMNEMRAECVRHYVERGHSPAHAELIVPRTKPKSSVFMDLSKRKKKKQSVVKKCPVPSQD